MYKTMRWTRSLTQTTGRSTWQRLAAHRTLCTTLVRLEDKSDAAPASNLSEAALLRQFAEMPVQRIRNFSIIAHVDHGKSTLADRVLELTGAISRNAGQHQVLDSLQVERERGITVKAQTASIFYKYKQQLYLLNLIDTPGHVDFSNEVSRSLAACDGVILLVDACHGVQAQTVANYHLAKQRQLAVVPVLNKIDIKHAQPDQVTRDMQLLFGIEPASVLRVSAKLGTGIDQVLERVIETIPPPNVQRESAFRALIFDSWFDKYRGALNLIYVLNGQLAVGQDIQSLATKKVYPVKSLSVLRPAECAVHGLLAGQVGLIACNMRNSKESIIGDTIHLKHQTATAAGSYRPQQPLVFAGIFPVDQSKHVALRSAIDKMVLNDSAVTVNVDSSPALGQGWRLGFLGLLHMEVFCQRLEQEHGAEPIITAPSVTYRIVLRNPKLIKQHGRNTLDISNAALLPDPSNIEEYHEPLVLGTIITPTEYVGQIIGLCVERRGLQQSSVNIDESRILMKYVLPLSEIILDFHDRLKSLSSGYASFSYEDHGYHQTHLVRLDIHLNGRPIEELCRIVHASKATGVARQMVHKLKDLIPKQMVQIAIQACVGSKVLARETIKAYRKDVTAKLYGGDVTRRMKLLKQQSEGKKKMRMFANIRVPHETFIDVLKR
ncbi:translation factor waclaw, mitochondrial [Drosophila novamexicana]|uniref:translation factor waclaw, mitochondrial n=1 Tax=Drosophila novamexicana TaxID=47314 RepID=UPI0011E5938B|nr:translation factor waclaw, mitochondrial [Drosophila novamexicana]XP_030568743.1 translation factor waclaw, mitochondrial [Drosophila novamexicana]